MAYIRNRVDDLGFPVRSRSEMLAHIDENAGHPYSEGLVPDPDDSTFFARSNDIMFQYMTGVLPRVKRTHSALSTHTYAVTLTTQVVKGAPRKGHAAFSAVLQRIKEMKGVLSIEGNYELTQAGALHVHALIHSTDYINSKKVMSANGNEHIKLDKMRNAKQQAATEKYIYKDLDNPKCLAVIHMDSPTVSTTAITLK